MKRHDFTGWVIHFVRDRNPDHLPNPFKVEDTEVLTEDELIKNLQYQEAFYDKLAGPLEVDAPSESVLRQIIMDCAIRPNYSYRKGKTTIYGGKPVICFTEMPVFSLVAYANSRGGADKVVPRGIAVMKQELFNAGGRPAIYGLASKEFSHRDIDYRTRIIDEKILPKAEQFRFVAYNPNPERRTIEGDWTHEREWRWTPDESESDTDGRHSAYLKIDALQGDFSPCLPLFRSKEEGGYFTKVVVIVGNEAEALSVQQDIVTLRDSGSNNYGEEFSADIEIKVVLIDQVVATAEASAKAQRIEDLSPVEMTPISRETECSIPDDHIRSSIDVAANSAKEAAEKLKNEWKNRDESGQMVDGCGMAHVVTYEATSGVLLRLLEMGLAKALSEQYLIDIPLPRGEQSYSYNYAAAEAAASSLTESLGIQFYPHGYYD